MKVEHKYAPKTLADIIYPSSTTEHLINGYATRALDGHLLLWGPNGTGKSTVANLLPYAVGGSGAIVDYKDFDELLANKNLGDYLANACGVAKLTTSDKHFLVFHEFDKAGRNQERLWKAMDYCGTDLMVIATSNEPNNVHTSLRSRFKNIEMSAVTPEVFLPRAQLILAAEGLTLPDEVVLRHLNVMRPLRDLRKYCGVLDELLYLDRSGHPIPPNP